MKRNIFEWIEIIMYGFFMFFFVIYVAKFGYSSLILEPINKWNMIFNLGIWFVLVNYCMDKLFGKLKEDKKTKGGKTC